MAGRPNQYDRLGQVTMRVYIDEKVRKEFKEFCKDNETSIQEVLEACIEDILKEERGRKNAARKQLQ